MNYKTIDVDYNDDDEETSQEARRCYRAAREYRRLRFNPVPRGPMGKFPAVKWKDFQQRLVTDEEMLSHYALYAGGVGIITGEVSGVIVIESDGPEGEAVLAAFEKVGGPLPQTFTVRSGSGRGLHRYFQHPGGHIPTRANPSIKLDVRGDRGFCVLPPSLHRSGARYEIVSDVTPARLPKGLLTFIDAENSKAGSAAPAEKRGANSQSSDVASDLGCNTTRFDALPVNPVNAAIIMTMLDALPDSASNHYDDWIKIGLALHEFDDGDVGLALWRRFSSRCHEKADKTDFTAVWSSFDGYHPGRRITIGSLWRMAMQYGWRAPRQWDRSTPSMS